ncbi:neutral zinc metallopeptidase [Mesorhizobium sp. AR02]|uniref:neutral zinc metallopeptidase n=1 Tax=Mesorhizobium sp. AR02 TaxID=2865837 RepID=UPI00215F16DD|nr:neutral zinc metallopeptidase [Mesorhizobium sp. AR02]UVK56312.1 neutral zinc metallopeptidase [Mesorhizobium sp. AR02]
MVRLSLATASLLAIATLLHAPTISEAAEVSTAAVPAPNAQPDDVKQLLSVALAETEDFWGATFKAGGLKYEEPKLVLYTGTIATACGPVAGTSYCASDHRIYLDPAFPELREIGLTGDFAKALIVAREVGHHVQNISDVPHPDVTDGNQEAAIIRSEQVELQADCFAGLWSRYVQDKGLLEDTDLTEARQLLRSLGDDQAANASKDPNAKRYGTSQQRIRWFDRGLAGKTIADCDTSSNPL